MICALATVEDHLGKAKPDQLGLRPVKISVGLAARRSLPLAPQVSQVGNAALVKRESVTLPLDHALDFKLTDVCAAAIEVLCQCRRADGLGPSGSWSRDRLSEGRAGLGHQRHSCCVPQDISLPLSAA
jgi:hypothetical protein